VVLREEPFFPMRAPQSTGLSYSFFASPNTPFPAEQAIPAQPVITKSINDPFSSFPSIPDLSLFPFGVRFSPVKDRRFALVEEARVASQSSGVQGCLEPISSF